MKLTPWFPANVKPVRAGVYEISSTTPWYRYWDGANWCAGERTPWEAEKLELLPLVVAFAEPWRGLAEEPK
jgi:hypothetical protein